MLKKSFLSIILFLSLTSPKWAQPKLQKILYLKDD